MEDARAGGGRWDWVVVLNPWACSASSRRRCGGGLSNPSPPLNPALLGRLARLSAVSSPIFRWLLFYEKIRGKSV